MPLKNKPTMHRFGIPMSIKSYHCVVYLTYENLVGSSLSMTLRHKRVVLTQTLFYYHLYICLCSTAKVCLETPEVALATTNITSRFYQKEATIECQVGYEFPDGDEFKTIICDVSNTGVNWTDPGYDTCQCKCIESVEWSVMT